MWWVEPMTVAAAMVTMATLRVPMGFILLAVYAYYTVVEVLMR